MIPDARSKFLKGRFSSTGRRFYLPSIFPLFNLYSTLNFLPRQAASLLLLRREENHRRAFVNGTHTPRHSDVC